jgi:CMP-N,N'-diacetyllegionaminic acid synthase
VTIVAIVTARGGSKRLPGKNLAPLGGLPLIAYTLRAAVASTRIARTYVTTDDREIAAAAAAHGASVIDRPAALAQDHSTSEDAVRHALLEIERQAGLPDAFCLLQPTSPLRGQAQIDGAIDAFIAAGGATSTLSVKRAPGHLNKLLRLAEGRLTPHFGAAAFRAKAGTIAEMFLPNGAIYVVAARAFLASGDLYGERMVPFEMDEESSLDIDTALDLRLAETIIATRGDDHR